MPLLLLLLSILRLLLLLALALLLKLRLELLRHFLDLQCIAVAARQLDLRSVGWGRV